MNKKTTILIVIIANIILVGSLVTIYFTVFYEPEQSNNTNEWTLTIKGDIENNLIFNITELEQYPSISRDYIIQGNPTYSAEYTGISLYYIVTEIANITVGADIRVNAIDHFAYTLTLDEVNSTQDIIIAYKKNGNYIDSYYDNGEGPLRLIIPQRFDGDWNGQFCVKFVASIEITLV